MASEIRSAADVAEQFSDPTIGYKSKVYNHTTDMQDGLMVLGGIITIIGMTTGMYGLNFYIPKSNCFLA